ADTERYSQARARDDIIAVLDHLRIDRAHIVGLSMGGFATLHVGLAHPERARSLVIAGCGYGARPGEEEKFRAECEVAAQAFDAEWPAAAAKYAIVPTRVQYQNKDTRGWTEIAARLADHSLRGASYTLSRRESRRHESPPLSSG